MKDIKKISLFFASHKGIVRTADLMGAKIYFNDIQRLLEQKVIEKIRYGYYQWLSDGEDQDEIQVVRRLIPDGILCMNTALFHYRYIDRIPNRWHIAVGKDSTKSRFQIDYPLMKPYYIKPELLKIGLTQVKINGISVSIYNKERVICDVLRRFSRIDREITNKSIQAFIMDREKSITRLMEYAKIFKVEKKVNNIIGVWL